jgi:serine/threonine protein kinase
MVGKTALGKYRLLRVLGRGSNAEVYLAEPLGDPGKRVVVKRVHDHVIEHPKFRQLFEAEVRSMGDFQHPYAVRMLDASLDDPIGPCLVLEYVPGITLETLLMRQRLLHVDRVAQLLGYFCHALQAAHEAGIIHRDLKPANLMVLNANAPTEALKVMDFGFAGFAAKPHIQLAELTGHGPIYAIGTPAYVSPEMIRGDRVDTRSDLYSVGVILFEMLTGRLPFTYDIQERLLGAHVREAPPQFHKIGASHVSPAVEAVVRLALSKYPNERQQSARELAEMFGKAIGENVWEETAPAGWVPPPRSEPARVAGQRPPSDPNVAIDALAVSHWFEVAIPERMVAAKLRGFVEDVDATVLASEPGLIRLRVGLPSDYQSAPATGGSTLLGWLNTLRKPAVSRGLEPIELELHLEKPDHSQVRVNVSVAYRPMKAYMPKDSAHWVSRCDKLNTMLRQYLGA